MFNYAVDPALLERFVPAGTELDLFEGKAWLSLVAFEFLATRVKGIRIPFHQTFGEVNLRFYVRRGKNRGVVFIRELVPKHAVAAVARLVFGENYSYTPMSHRLKTDAAGGVKVEYTFGSGRHRCRMELETEGSGRIPENESLDRFITEHYWGYTAQAGGRSREYEVQHPQWRVRKAARACFSGDAAGIYGAQFSQVLASIPDCAFLCEGSPVAVFQGSEIRS